MTLKNRNRKTDIAVIHNKSSGHPQEPQHGKQQVGNSALDISNPWIWPGSGPCLRRNLQSNAYLPKIESSKKKKKKRKERRKDGKGKGQEPGEPGKGSAP